VIDAAIQALHRKTPISISTILSQLACLGGEVELQATQDAMSFWRRDGFIEGARRA
jgi:hypothetical protein